MATAGEIGVQRPDGRKPEAGEGAGPGSVGVTGNPVAGSGIEKSGDTCQRNCTNFGFTSEYVKQAGKGRDFVGSKTIWVLDAVRGTYNSSGYRRDAKTGWPG